MSEPERIWIEDGEDCPYFYHESELADVGGPVDEYIRRDVVDRLVERAFRDGLTYGSICEVSDPDAAWQSSAARAALAKIGEKG